MSQLDNDLHSPQRAEAHGRSRRVDGRAVEREMLRQLLLAAQGLRVLMMSVVVGCVPSFVLYDETPTVMNILLNTVGARRPGLAQSPEMPTALGPQPPLTARTHCVC